MQAMPIQPKPIRLESAPKQYEYDQDKIISPEKTVAAFKARLAQTGLDILEDVVRIDNGRLGIPVYYSLCGPAAQAVIGNVKQMGKGATPEQSQASAVMELAERYSLFSFHHNPRHFLTAAQKDISQPTLGFDMIARSVADDSDDLPIVRPFFENLPLQWTWADNLTRQETLLVPFNWFWTINQFNGSSAGNCNEEALCQGICEVVERHVSALTCRRLRDVPLMDVRSCSDPVALELLAKYRSAGIELHLSDFTCDMGIPSVGVLAWDPGTFPDTSEIVWTAGTAPHPARALCRALTEVAQLAGDFNSKGNYEASGLPKFHHLEEAAYITHSGTVGSFQDLPDLSHSDIKTEVERCIQVLQGNHLEVITVNVRHPQLDIPAFYNIVPGTFFRERAVSASVAMICAKIATETFPAGEALAWLTRMDQALPNKYYIQFYLGQINLNQAAYEAAQRCLNRASELDPPQEDLTSIYTYLGLCHKEKGEFQSALKALQLAQKLDQERTDTLNLLGFCYFKLGDHEAAIEAFQKLVAINPSSAIDYANLAVNYRALGDRTKAIKFYKLALAIDPEIEFAREHLQQLGINLSDEP